jgi:hypothetical protein
MRCSKVREFYLKNRDGLLNEAEKMKLEEHMDACISCASYMREMNRCLDLLAGLPEISPSENFEWNLKRAILQEKTRLVRSRSCVSFSEWQWGLRFVSSAAAVIVLVVAGTWFMSGRGGRSVVTPARNGGTARSSVKLSPREYDIINLTGSGYHAGRQNANYNLIDFSTGMQQRYYTGSNQIRRVQPTQFAVSSREDSLMKENEFLWKRIEILETELVVLQRLLTQERARR